MSGVTYYKLEQRYEGDRTKGCGLTSAEVDANFHFLRGYDIKDATLSDDGILTLHRVNCDDIVIDNLPDVIQEITDNAIASSDKPFDFSGSTYDPNTGILTIKLNGAEFEVPGFEDTAFDFKLYVGYGLDGNGTKNHPIRLSLANQTGFFAPVECVFDGEPYDGKAKRYITKEQTSPYGLLYDFENAQKLDEYLSEHGNGWRIPTDEDWEDLFDAVQCDEVADMLKDKLFENGPDTDFKALPTEYVDTKKYASFWSVGVDDCRDGYPSKGFIEGNPYVLENAASVDKLRSIRLVKDGDLPSTEVETICGNLYRTIKIGSLVWTIDNACFENSEINGEKPCGLGNILSDDEYENSVVEKYFINENDTIAGTVSKKELPANSVVMIHEYSGLTDEEWVVVEDPEDTFNLKPRGEIIKEKYIDPEIQAVYLAIESVELELLDAIEDVKEEVDFHTEILSALTLSAETLESDIDDIKNDIEELSGTVVDNVSRIENLEQSAVTFSENISDINDNVETLSGTVVENVSRIEALERRADESDTDSENLADKVAEHENRLNSLDTKTDTTNQNLSNLSDTVEANAEFARTGLTLAYEGLEAVNQDLNGIHSDMISDVKVNGVSLEKTGNTVNVEIPIMSVPDNDRLLSVDGKILKSSFNVVYNPDSKEINFYGNDTVNPFYTIDTSDFVKDGILESAVVVYNTEGKKVLRLVFNTESGQAPVDVELTDLVTEYTVARGSDDYLGIDGFEISFKPDGLKNQYATNEKLDALSATTLALDKKVGPGFKDENDNPISVCHKVTELERMLLEYTAENQLEFTEDFPVAGIIGTLGTGYYQNGNVIPAGTKVMDVLKNILQKELDPIGEMPKVKIEFLNDGEYEMGTEITPSYRITLTDGKYNYADGTNVNAEIEVTSANVRLFNNGTSTPYTATDVPTGSFNNYQVTEGAKLTLLANIDYASTFIPKSNLGNNRPDSKIPDGRFDFVESENTITVYRPTFFGSLNDGDISYDDTPVMTISDSELELFTKHDKNGIPKTIPIKESAELVVILVPNISNYTIEKVIDLDSGLDLMDMFIKKQTSIKTYTGDNGAGYTAYIFDPGTQLGANEYRIVSRYIDF